MRDEKMRALVNFAIYAHQKSLAYFPLARGHLSATKCSSATMCQFPMVHGAHLKLDCKVYMAKRICTGA